MNRVAGNLASIILIALALAACASAPSTKSADKESVAQTDEETGSAPVTTVEEALSRGDTAWRTGNLDLALYLFVQGLQVDSRNAPLLAKIGAIHESRGNLPLARKAFELAHEYDPADARLSERLGLILIALGDKTAAFDVFRAADRASPGRSRTLDGLGQLAMEKGQYQQAVEYFERARLAEPRNPTILLHRAQAFLLLENYSSSENDARLALTFAGGNLPDAWRCLGQAQASQKRYDEAFESFMHVGSAAFAYNAIGEAAMKNADDVAARGFLQKATQASPVYFESAYRNLAVVKEKLRQQPTQSGS